MTQYRAEIDGLRAVAVLPVILFHAGYENFSGGFVGVDVFFVISGYLITTILLEAQQAGTFSIITFYERRARRILPALFLVLLTCLPLAVLCMGPSGIEQFSTSLVAVALFASNIQFWKESGYFDTSVELKPLLHTWSLAIEEQFYLLFPFVLLAIHKLSRPKVLATLATLCIASLWMAESWVSAEPSGAFYLLPTRAWELLTGAISAVWLIKPQRGPTDLRYPVVGECLSLFGVVSIAYSIGVLDQNSRFPGLLALAPTLGTTLIILFATSRTLVGKVLAAKPLVSVGLISYSAYLWHQPLFAFTRHQSLTEPGKVTYFLLTCMTLVLAYLTWKYVETPFRNRARVNRRQIFSLAFFGSTFFITWGAIGIETSGFEGLFETTYQLVADAKANRATNKACWLRIRKSRSLRDACSIGIDGSQKSFTLLGDSQAGSLVPALDKAARLRGSSGFNYTFESCPPARLMKRQKQDEVQLACNSIRAEFFGRLGQPSLPQTLIVMSRWTARTERTRFDNGEGGVEQGEVLPWSNEYTTTLGYVEAIEKDQVDSIVAMLNAGHKVILIYPVPEAGWDVPIYLSKLHRIRQVLRPADGSTSYARFLERNARSYQILDKVGEHRNLVRIKPADMFCNTYVKDRCVVHLDGIPVYGDDDHLSNFGADLLVQKIFDASQQLESP